MLSSSSSYKIYSFAFSLLFLNFLCSDITRMVRIDNKVDRADAIISCCMKRWLLLTNIVSYEMTNLNAYLGISLYRCWNLLLNVKNKCKKCRVLHNLIHFSNHNIIAKLRVIHFGTVLLNWKWSWCDDCMLPCLCK